MKKQKLVNLMKKVCQKATPKKPLLSIELENVNAVPVVIYKGERHRGLVSVDFLYRTDTDTLQPTELEIKYHDVNQLKNNDFSVKVIGFKR